MPRRAATVTLSSLGWALAVLATPAAQAEEGRIPEDQAVVAEARDRFAKGLQLYREGMLEPSLAEFERAVKLAPSYRLQYNIGQVQYELGNYVAALRAFQRYLAEGADRIPPDRRAHVQREIESLEGHMAKVKVRTNVAGAVVAVDEVRAGLAPLSRAVWVNPGVHRISALKAGYLPSTVTVTAASGEQVDVALDLTAHPGASAPTTAPLVPLSDLQAASDPHPSRHRIKTLVSLLATGALAGSAASFALLTHRAQQDFDEQLAGLPDTRAALKNAHNRLATFAAVTGALALGTVVAGGVALYFGVTEGRPPARSPLARPALQLSLVATPVGVLATGSF
jgi:tetratricopeptide (TPR) repeat protein